MMLDNLSEKDNKLFRAVLLVILDEFNTHAAKINAILTAIDSGGTLAAVKAGIAAINAYPPRTIEQLREAVAAKIAAGDADG